MVIAACFAASVNSVISSFDQLDVFLINRVWSVIFREFFITSVLPALMADI